jgi:uncharacterized protein (TIGR02172 family)
MSGDLGYPISYGRTAEIYSWDEKHVLKLFHDWFSLENIENEARIARAIHKSGLPIPDVGEIVRVKERNGLLYERVHGQSMYTAAKRKPWNVPRYFRRSAELHVEIHSRSISADLPSQRQRLERNIHEAKALPGHLRARALAALEAMPDGSQLCHGDFWGGNILITPHGEVIIDWFRASHGNPLADLARTSNATLGFTRTRQIQRTFLSYGTSKASQIKNSLLQFLVRVFYPIYLHRYFQLRPGGEEEYQLWLPIVAAARLADNIPEFEKMLIAQVEKYL